MCTVEKSEFDDFLKEYLRSFCDSGPKDGDDHFHNHEKKLGNAWKLTNLKQ